MYWRIFSSHLILLQDFYEHDEDEDELATEIASVSCLVCELSIVLGLVLGVGPYKYQNALYIPESTFNYQKALRKTMCKVLSL